MLGIKRLITKKALRVLPSFWFIFLFINGNKQQAFPFISTKIAEKQDY